MTSRSKLLKIAEVAEWLGVARSTIYKWIEEGRFPPPIKIGERDRARVAARWEETTIQKWIEERRDETHSEQ